MSDKKNHRSQSELLKYLRGYLSGGDRHKLEKEMQSDPFNRDAMEGFEAFSPEQIEQDLNYLQNRIRRRIKRRRRITLYSAAAAIATLMIISTLFVKLSDFSPQEKSKKISESFIKKETETAESEEIKEGASEELIIEKRGAATDKEPVRTSEDIPLNASPQKTEAKRGLGPEKIEKIGEDEGVNQKPEVSENVVEKLEAFDYAVVSENEDAEEITILEAEPKMAGENKMGDTPTPRRSKNISGLATGEQAAVKQAPSERYIEGVVISTEDSMPLPGASVFIKGTTQGAVTDKDGYFNLEISGENNPTLVAAFIGMESKEYTVKNNENVTLAMKPDLATLDEVVVIGYGTTKSESTSTSSVKMVEISDSSAPTSYTAPSPVGGNRLFKKYIEENIKFPADITFTDRAVVILRFTIDSKGEIVNIEALQTEADSLTEEAKRLLLEGPEWEPAQKNGSKIDDQVRLRIIFER